MGMGSSSSASKGSVKLDPCDDECFTACSSKSRRTNVAPDGRFLDADFPPADSSLGVPKAGRSFLTPIQRSKAQWIRLPSLLQANRALSESDSVGSPRLEWDDIEPSDLAQGWLGNCWLIASIAALAEFPCAVKRLFVEANVGQGRYVVQLFGMGQGKWENVEIDDFIPCVLEDDWDSLPFTEDELGKRIHQHKDVYDEHGRKKLPAKWVPLFGRPKGSKVWALLLEKAMAKFVGSYAFLSGGSEPYALTAFTGFPIVYCFLRAIKDNDETRALRNKWEWCGAQYINRQSTGQCYAVIPDAPDQLRNADMWTRLLDYDSRNYLMTASITRYEMPKDMAGFFREDGLILGHAYSLISGRAVSTREGEPIQVVMLRNPHGKTCETSEGIFASKWRGAWCDGSYLWTIHPEVAAQLNYDLDHVKDDGIFYMSWEDFCDTFDKICVLAKSMAEPRAARAFHRRKQNPSAVCLGLERMASANTIADLRMLSITFDPFTSLPDFLDDGTLETRLCWEASKPGHLQSWLDLNRSSGNDGGFQLLLKKIQELGLSDALGATGFLTTPRNNHVPKSTAS